MRPKPGHPIKLWWLIQEIFCCRELEARGQFFFIALRSRIRPNDRGTGGRLISVWGNLEAGKPDAWCGLYNLGFG